MNELTSQEQAERIILHDKLTRYLKSHINDVKSLICQTIESGEQLPAGVFILLKDGLQYDYAEPRIKINFLSNVPLDTIKTYLSPFGKDFWITLMRKIETGDQFIWITAEDIINLF